MNEYPGTQWGSALDIDCRFSQEAERLRKLYRINRRRRFQAGMPR